MLLKLMTFRANFAWVSARETVSERERESLVLSAGHATRRMRNEILFALCPNN